LKVVQVTPGRYHHFDLARELHRRGMLKRIFSAYPRWKLTAHNEERALSADLIETFPYLGAPYMAAVKAMSRFRSMRRPLSYLGWQVLETIDWYVSKHLPPCDVLIAQSGCGLRSGRVAKDRGIKYVCDRGSSHIRYEDSLMREEYARWHQEYVGTRISWIDKEEREYELADLITVPSAFALRSFVESGVPLSKIQK